MGFMGWFSPGKLQQRAETYTGLVLDAIRARRTSETSLDSQATAAVEFGVGLYARAFMSAAVDPMVPALSPEYLAGIARDLLVSGNHVAAIMVSRRDGVMLHRAATWDIDGDYDPATWMYDIDLNGPSRQRRFRATHEEVVHIRINASSTRPWVGESPLTLAGVSAELLAKAEGNLKDEMSTKNVKLLTHPNHFASIDALKTDIGAGAGKILPVTGGAGGSWKSQSTGDWGQVRLGPDPQSAAVQLRGAVAADVVSALGIPSGLLVPQQGTVTREAYRQLLASGIVPLGQTIQHELSQKLEMPIRFSFRRMRAADVAAGARAYGSLMQAGMSDEESRMFAGLDEV